MVRWPESNYIASIKSINHEKKASVFLWCDQHTDPTLQQLKDVFDITTPAPLSVTATSPSICCLIYL